MGWWLATLVIFVELVIVLGGLIHKRAGNVVSAKPLGKGQNVFASQRRGALAPFFCVWRVVVAYGWRCCACGFCDFAVMSLMTYGL